jgi:dolichyl-phosphate-mannose--protein O-mannosyl transferase
MMETRVEPAPRETSTRLAALRARLVPPMPLSTFWGWAGPLLVTAFGTYLRFVRLGDPRAVIFDETYYVPDALGILRFGVEHNYASNRNGLLLRGDPHVFTNGGEFVVHPPFGKVLIAGGEWLFGLSPFGWRFAAAVVGSLSILLLARIARRMTRSTLLGCFAGLLLAADGLEFVMSRTALLDIFVMFWVLAAFGCLVVDRDLYRARMADAAAGSAVAGSATAGAVAGSAAAGSAAAGSAAAGESAAAGAPRTPVRWWRIGAGVCLGLACGSKWNGLWFVPAFAALSFAWDVGARRTAGLGKVTGPGLLRYLGGLAGSFVALPLVAYLATWTGWFATSSGYDRNWAQLHGVNIPVISPLISLFQYNKAMLTFNTGLQKHHPYQSQPWTWLTISRPVSYYWSCPTSGHGVCAKGDAAEVLAIGTPVLWWGAILALLVCLGWWLTRRDWRAGAVLVGVAAGWLPWFAYAKRTQFYFYSVAFVPFLVLAVVLCLGLVMGSATASAARRAVGASLAGAFVLAVLLNFAYLYPLLTAQAIPYPSWLAHMWYHGWI